MKLSLFNFAQDRDTTWFDARDLGIEGKGFTETEEYYDRLPASAKTIVRPKVWELSHETAGMYLRFRSNADSIYFNWSLTKSILQMNHMPASGVSGLDLYCLKDGKYIFVDNARPDKQNNNKWKIVVKDPDNNIDEYLVYLPLYNGVKSLRIGVDKGYSVTPSNNNFAIEKPVVFYGTSIMQGACASRPGMAIPAILQRRLDFPYINLGFSGNARTESEIIEIISEIDASIFVLDAHRNMSVDEVKTNTEPAIRIIRKKHPHTPILLVEESNVAETFPTQRGKAMYEVYKKLVDEGEKNLYYLKGDNLIGLDGDGTVDRIHPTDIGMIRYADEYEIILKQILNKN